MLKKVGCTFCILIVSQFLFSQSTEQYTQKNSLYGFNFGVHYSVFNFPTGNNSILQNQNENSIGTRMGIIADYSLNRQIHFVPKLEMAFYGNKPTYQTTEGEKDFDLSNITLESKLHFSVDLYDRISTPYLLLGGSYAHAIEKETDQSKFPSKSFFSLDLGVGYHHSGKFFVFSPELRYSYGLNDINNAADLNADILLHSLSLVFNLKG